MINVCIPVLKRYDLLRDAVESLHGSTLSVTAIYLVNNGRDGDRLAFAMANSPAPFHVHEPEKPLGVAESWNWFLKNVPEDRVIANDDVLFAPDSLAKLAADPSDLVWANGCGFSCFLIRDACVAKVGYFDEEISPGYGYYEDEDYLQRIDGKGTKPSIVSLANVECGIVHLKSQTLAVATPREAGEHHRRFLIAQGNYMRKWGLKTL